MKKLCETPTALCRNQIIEVKNKALRRGVWYRVLTRLERASIDLVIRVVEKVRSFILQKMLSSLLKKLEESMESKVLRLIHEIGGALALRMSQIAQNWGNKSAARWAEDSAFMQYLALNHMSAPQ